jgi:membrane-bound inhibitor of C-type lysozyme
MKKTLIIIAGLILLIVGAVLITGHIKFNVIGDDIYFDETSETQKAETYTLTTKNGEKGTLVYSTESKDEATLTIDEKSYELKRTRSASGAKYCSLAVFFQSGPGARQSPDRSRWQTRNRKPSACMAVDGERRRRQKRGRPDFAPLAG